RNLSTEQTPDFATAPTSRIPSASVEMTKPLAMAVVFHSILSNPFYKYELQRTSVRASQKDERENRSGFKGAVGDPRRLVDFLHAGCGRTVPGNRQGQRKCLHLYFEREHGSRGE